VAGAAILVISAGASAGWARSSGIAIDPGAGALDVIAAACRRGPMVATGATMTRPAPGGLDGLMIADASRRPPVPGKWAAENVAPGRYAVYVRTGLNVTGRLDVALGRPDSVMTSCQLTDQPPGRTSCEVSLPAGARALWITGDAGVARTAESVSLELIEPDLSDRCALRAERVVNRTPPMFVVGGRAWVEGPGLWTSGDGAVSLAVPVSGAMAALRVRAGGAGGEVSIESGAWRDHRRLDAGQVWDVDVPAPGAQSALVSVATTAAFTPAERDASSVDRRRLGVWVEGR
jgi:hypothetical protein